MLSVSAKIPDQEVMDTLSEVKEESGKMKVVKSGHPVLSLWLSQKLYNFQAVMLSQSGYPKCVW